MTSFDLAEEMHKNKQCASSSAADVHYVCLRDLGDYVAARPCLTQAITYVYASGYFKED